LTALVPFHQREVGHRPPRTPLPCARAVPPSPQRLAPLFNPDRLRAAREARGLTQAALAQILKPNLSASAISQLEQGSTKPTTQTLARLAEALNFPETYFVRSSVVPDGFFRSLRATTVGTRRRALVHASMLHDLVEVLVRYIELPTFERSPAESTPTSREGVEAIARRTRERFRLGEGPIENMIDALEQHGIVVGRLHLQDGSAITKGRKATVDAFSVPYSDYPVVILADDKGKTARSRFDAAHELGHLVMHDESCAGSKEIEQQAQWFAAEFLMPATSIEQELPTRVKWRELLDLKVRWGVSLAALLMRSKTLGRIDDLAYLNAIKLMSANGWRVDEPGDDELGAPESPRLVDEALQLLSQDGMTVEAIAAEACLPLDDVQALLSAAGKRRRLQRFDHDGPPR
jgi:Zn-dependent peptidase ImmA (M78 family)/DNA-binding XRE family transcriptional regulator